MKIPIKKYEDNPTLSWEERYKKLDAHHLEETAWMIERIKTLTAQLATARKEVENHIHQRDARATQVYQQSLYIDKLEDAIRNHRSKTGHEMCWENDEELWAVLGDNVEIDHTPPEWCEFMTKCAEYRKSRDRNEKEAPPEKSKTAKE